MSKYAVPLSYPRHAKRVIKPIDLHPTSHVPTSDLVSHVSIYHKTSKNSMLTSSTSDPLSLSPPMNKIIKMTINRATDQTNPHPKKEKGSEDSQHLPTNDFLYR